MTLPLVATWRSRWREEALTDDTSAVRVLDSHMSHKIILISGVLAIFAVDIGCEAQSDHKEVAKEAAMLDVSPAEFYELVAVRDEIMTQLVEHEIPRSEIETALSYETDSVSSLESVRDEILTRLVEREVMQPEIEAVLSGEAVPASLLGMTAEECEELGQKIASAVGEVQLRPRGTGPQSQNRQQCIVACNGGTESIQNFCRSLPDPRLRASCWALQFVGKAACIGWCYWYF